MSAAAAGLATAVALLLIVPRSSRLPAPESLAGPTRRRGPVWSVAGAAVAAAGLAVWLDGVRLAVGLVLVGVGIGVLGVWRRRRSVVERTRVRTSVVELSEALVGELRAGRPVVAALERCRAVWAPFGSVAVAARLGADVPAALRRLAAAPGAEGLDRLASAWLVSQRTGCSLAGVLDQVAVSGRSELASAWLVRSELASAQATARLVALLPMVTLAMAAGAGGDPWHFLLDTPPGVTCLAVGAALVFAGLWWIDRIAAGVGRW